MGAIMSTGQITLIDLTDERVSSFYLQANQSKIQVYDVNTKTYSPDYSNNPGLIITPYFFFGNEDNTAKLNSSNLTYSINGTTVTSGMSGVTQSGNKLTISKNINSGVAPFNVETLKIVATIKESTVTDDTTGITIDKPLTADIEFAKVNTGLKGSDGAAGISVISVEQQYILSADSTNAPAQANESWSTTNPSWQKDTYLWIRTKITYSNDKIEYTDPYCDSSWKAAADGVAGLNTQIETINATMQSMQAEIDGAIETWYLAGDPTSKDFINPWKSEEGDSNEIRDKHIGDLYFDTNTGKSYRYFKDGNTYKWQIISDEALSQAINDINNLRTDVDAKVTIFYGNSPAPSNPKEDDMWIKDDGSFWQYTGTEWILSSYSIESVEVQYAKNKSNTTPPEGTAFGSTSPEWEEGAYIWQRSKTTYKGGVKQPDYSDPVCISAAAARAISISGEQVFKTVDGTNYSPETITLSANLVGGLTVGGWYYKNGSNWTSLNTTSETISINYNHAAFGSSTTAAIKVVAVEDQKYFDIISLYKVSDGNSPPSVFLTNENFTVSASASGKTASTAQTITSNVVAYSGTTKVLPEIGTITGAVSGMTISTETTNDKEIKIKIVIAKSTTLGSTSSTSGILTIPVTSPVSTNLTISWSKINTGAKGNTGDAGADAIFAIVESTSGKVIFTDADSENIVLQSSLYIGGAVVDSTDVAYKWSSIPGGDITGGNERILEVSRDMVPSARSFICTITYNGTSYKDSIALSDKTDPIYCKIDSSNGDKFTNRQIATTLTCRVFDSKGEVDAYGTKYIYTWEKYVDQELDMEWGNAGSKTGKSIEIDHTDVTGKAVFTCSLTLA